MKLIICIQCIVLAYTLIDINTTRFMSQQQLIQDPHLLVHQVINRNTIDNTLLRNYYVIKSISKQKKRAYLNILRIYNKLIALLKKNRLIYNDDTFIHSKIKPQYLNKKRSWTFSIIFVLYGNLNELDQNEIDMRRLGVQKLHTPPSINFLNEKMLALYGFSRAKDRVNEFLKKYSSLEIHQVQDVEIKGYQFQNSDMIQIQLQNEFNFSQDEILNQQIQDVINKQIPQNKLQIWVKFRIGSQGINNQKLSQQQSNISSKISLSSSSSKFDSSSNQSL